MPNEYDWIPQSVGNIANIFGLNPKAAAEGRKLQSENDYLQARIRNTDADTSLTDDRRKVYGAQADQYSAGARSNDAQAGKYNAEKEGVALTNKVRGSIGEAVRAYLTAPPEARRAMGANLGGMVAQMGGNPESISEALRNIESLLNSTENPRLSAQQGKVAAAFESDAVFSEAEGQAVRGEREAAADNRERIQNQGRLAVAQATNSGPIKVVTPNEAFALIAAEDSALDQATKVKLARRIISRQMQNGEDALTALEGAMQDLGLKRSVRDKPGIGTGDEPALVQGPIATAVGNAAANPATAAAAPPAAGATPAAPATSAPATAAAPANLPVIRTRQDAANLPEGAEAVYQGRRVRKQGGQLVPI